jgi:hypothetical protein
MFAGILMPSFHFKDKHTIHVEKCLLMILLVCVQREKSTAVPSDNPNPIGLFHLLSSVQFAETVLNI